MASLSFSYLPEVATFLFVFALVFGLLSKAGTFKDKRINGIIAAVIGMFSLTSAELVSIMGRFMPLAAGVLVLLAIIMFVKDAFSSKKKGDNNNVDMLPTAVVLATGLGLLGVFWDDIASYIPLEYRDAGLWLIGIAIAVMILYVSYRHNSGR